MLMTARAINFALSGDIPDWIELLPAGPDITGTDGRSWILTDPSALVDAFNRTDKHLVVDWEHASEHRAPQGLEAPAAGWIDRLDVRNGQLWGHVEWTARAIQQLQNREYRYLSPVFTYRKDTRQIVALTSVALTNQPNLELTALNREEPVVTIPAAILSHPALELEADANEAAVLTALNRLHETLQKTMATADQPPLERFIPRADYDAVLARATNAEIKLADIEKARQAQEINALIESALRAHKISPATVDYYRAMCQTGGGMDAFKDFLDKAPVLIGADSGLDTKAPPALSDPAMEFAANAALRAEFGDLETYQAWRRAVDGGKAIIFGSKSV